MPNVKKTVEKGVMGKSGSAILVWCVVALFGSTLAQLKLGFYDKSCPKAEQIVLKYVKKHIPNAPSLAAALLKLNYVDCLVQVHVCPSSSSAYVF